MNNHTTRMSCWTALGIVTQLAREFPTRVVHRDVYSLRKLECTIFRGNFNWQVLINVLECFVS
jgi:hypothetical protein